jgi:RNA polymerase sigma-70 factor (ECF subfamily)
VTRSKTGDLSAFEELVRRYENKVFTVIYRFVGNWADVNDLAQETFIRVYQSLPNFRQESGFATWLYSIAANICRDELRKKRRRPKISLDEITASSDLLPSFEAGPDCLENRLEQCELQDAVQECLSTLPDEYRLALVMREIQGLSYREIAVVLGCSTGTVKSRLSRARLAFKQEVTAKRELFQLLLRLEDKGG